MKNEAASAVDHLTDYHLTTALLAARAQRARTMLNYTVASFALLTTPIALSTLVTGSWRLLYALPFLISAYSRANRAERNYEEYLAIRSSEIGSFWKTTAATNIHGSQETSGRPYYLRFDIQPAIASAVPAVLGVLIGREQFVASQCTPLENALVLILCLWVGLSISLNWFDVFYGSRRIRNQFVA